MQDHLNKLRYIVLPFLFGSLVFLCGYAALRWLIDIHLNAGNFTQELWELWMPMIWAGIFTGFIMRERFMLLSISWKRREFLYLMSGIALAVSMIISQKYITSQSSRMFRIDSLSDIETPKPNDRYNISYYRIETDKAGLHFESRRVQKRYGSDLSLYIYCAIPLAESGQFTGPYTYWYVKMYSTRVATETRLNIEKEQQDLYNKVLSDLNANRFREISHLRIAPLTENYKSMLAAIKNSQAVSTKDPVILLPETSPLEKSSKGLKWTFWAFCTAQIIVILIAFFSKKIPEKKLAGFIARSQLPMKERMGLHRLRSVFRKGVSSGTLILISLNVIVFLVLTVIGVSPVSPSPAELFEFGGVTIRSAMDEGEWWRIFSSMFIHSGMMHLLMNMLILAFVGMVVESVVKRWKFILIYFASGIGAFLLASRFLATGTVMIGASGSIFGIMGVLLSLYLKNPKKHREYLTLFLWTGGISLLFGLLPGVSNSAHIGGLITGFVLGLLLCQPSGKKRKRL